MPDREEGIRITRIIKDSEANLKGLRPNNGTFLRLKKDNFIDGNETERFHHDFQ